MSSFQIDSRIFKAFCDESRLQILSLLKEKELCAFELQELLDIGQSTLSHHMKILCASGIVSASRRGKWVYYNVDPAGTEYAKELIDKYTKADET